MEGGNVLRIFVFVFVIISMANTDVLKFLEGTHIVPLGFEQCEGKDIVPRYIKLSKYNRSHHHLYCNFTIPFDLDEDISADVIAKKKTQGHKVHALKVNVNLCKFVSLHIKELFQSLFESGGYKNAQCPVPKGFYYWDVILDIKFKNLPNVPNGEYEMTIILYKGEKRTRVLCQKFIFEAKSTIKRITGMRHSPNNSSRGETIKIKD